MQSVLLVCICCVWVSVCVWVRVLYVQYLVNHLPELPRLVHQRLLTFPVDVDRRFDQLAQSQRQHNTLLLVIALLLAAGVALLVLQMT